jgi:hypothetical protein
MAQGGFLATFVELMVEYGVVSMNFVIGDELRDVSNHAKTSLRQPSFGQSRWLRRHEA